jgi:hypothetical protein
MSKQPSNKPKSHTTRYSFQDTSFDDAEYNLRITDMSRGQTQQQKSDNVETDKLCTAQTREEVEMVVGFCCKYKKSHLLSANVLCQ